MKILIGLLVILLCLLQYRLWYGDANVFQVRDFERQIDELKQQAVVLKARNDALEAEVKDLRNGIEAIEERARQDLGMIKKGETFFQIIEPQGE